MDNDVLVLWDIDGTLLNAGGVGQDRYDVVFRQLFGRPPAAPGPEAAAPAAPGGRTDRAVILDLLVRAGVADPRRYVDRFIAGLGTHAQAVQAAVTARGRVLPGAAEVLAAVARLRSRVPRRVYQSVLTRNVRPVAEMKLAALGLGDGLDLCIGAYGDDHEDAAELVQVARRRAAGVHGRTAAAFAGAATVVVGATPLDVSAALAAGARAVAVASGGYPADDLAAAGARAVLPDLTDTGAVLREILG